MSVVHPVSLSNSLTVCFIAVALAGVLPVVNCMVILGVIFIL